MICIGSFKSLESLLDKPQFTGAPFEVRTWVGSDTRLISPLVDWLMNLIAESGCVRGEEQYVELAFREALSNAMLHGKLLGRSQAGSCPLLLRTQEGSLHRR